MRVSYALIFAALVSGCFEPEDGQFLCADGRCPEGTFCSDDGVCLINPPDADAGVADGGSDVGNDRFDGGGDGGPGDSGSDVSSDAGPTESCAPNAAGEAVDENGNGAIDEGCPWFFGTPHLVEGANLSQGDIFAIAFGDARDVAYLSAETNDFPVQRITRANVHEAFPADTAERPLVGTEGRNTMVTVSGDELLLVAQAGALVAWTRSSTTEPFELASLNLPAEGVHPSLSPNGLELYYAEGSPRTIYRVRRDSRDTVFGAPEPVDVGNPSTGSIHFPQVSSDGFMLFFANQRGLEAATRESLDEPFVGGEVLAENDDALNPLFIKPTYLPELREMWLIALPGIPGTPDTHSVWRVEVCRDGPCETSPPPCTGLRSEDGFSCYVAPDGVFTWTGAVNACESAGSELISFSSEDEVSSVRSDFGDADSWIGLSRSLGGDFRWNSGEPTLHLPWGGGEPTIMEDHDCVLLTDDVFSNRDCVSTAGALCETRRLPSWAP